MTQNLRNALMTEASPGFHSGRQIPGLQQILDVVAAAPGTALWLESPRP
jgi:hypothetical protein